MRPELFRIVSTAVVGLSLWSSILAQSSGFDTSRMDRNVDACDDFFQFANGTWLKNTEIPASQARWGTFNILAESNRDVLHDILEKAAKTKSPAGSNMQLIGDYYSACMDEASIEKAGITPLEPYFKQIAKIKTAADVKRQIAEMHKIGFPAVFRFAAGRDLKDSNSIIINSGQAGLSLLNKDYYTKTDARTTEIREKFVTYMTNLFNLVGDDAETAAKNAVTVMTMQMRLASASMAPVELRDPDKTYNKIKLADAQAVIPNMSLTNYMKLRGIPVQPDINLGQPDFFKEVNAMLTDVPVENWKAYFRWMVLSSLASSLSKAFVDENFNFFGKTVSGTRELEPRWRRCVRVTDGALGEALGAEYIKTKFTPEAEAKMDAMITNLFAAMKSHIDGLPWMSSETKTKAQAKLATYKRKVGYNKKPRGFAGLRVVHADYAGNIRRSNIFQINRNIADLAGPADKTRWNSSPPTVDASYSAVNNDITFPAGVLQPPVFNFMADDAINYGGIGAVIGHEISHGFDDEGSKFGPEGNLKSWWTPEDRQKFEDRALCLVEQFNGYEVQPGLNINGKLTLGENIGDLGGLAIAYTALADSMNGKAPASPIDGFTPEQRFFLGWAQVWAAKATPQFERSQVLGDPHSTSKWRVNGPLSNMPEFASAWGCKTGQRMVREKFCRIW